MKTDTNFLYFLTSHRRLNPYDNEIVMPLFRPIGEEELDKRIKAAVYGHDDTRPINLYIHIPFCAQNCTYCHCSHCKLTGQEELLKYERLLKDQMQHFSPFFSRVKMSSIYFGGGTPTLLSDNGIQRIFETLHKRFKFKKDVQVNFEAHPASLTENKLRVLKECGVNRLSLGVQSLDPKVLKKIARTQSKKMVLERIKDVRKVGFRWLNVDLVAGLPQQSEESLTRDLDEIIQQRPEVIHLTPFSNLSATLFGKMGRYDVREFIARRHVLINTAKEMLENAGYRKDGFGPYQSGSDDGESYIEFSYINRAASVLGLGIYAKSDLSGKLAFTTRPQNRLFSKPVFSGYALNERFSMANYAIINVLKGLDHAMFGGLFGKDFCSLFEEETQVLKEEGLVTGNRKTTNFSAEWNIKNLYRYFSLAKLFYGDKILKELKNAYAGEFKKREDYSHEKYLMNLLQDLWFVCLYYGVGL